MWEENSSQQAQITAATSCTWNPAFFSHSHTLLHTHTQLRLPFSAGAPSYPTCFSPNNRKAKFRSKMSPQNHLQGVQEAASVANNVCWSHSHVLPKNVYSCSKWFPKVWEKPEIPESKGGSHAAHVNTAIWMWGCGWGCCPQLNASSGVRWAKWDSSSG